MQQVERDKGKKRRQLWSNISIIFAYPNDIDIFQRLHNKYLKVQWREK